MSQLIVRFNINCHSQLSMQIDYFLNFLYRGTVFLNLLYLLHTNALKDVISPLKSHKYSQFVCGKVKSTVTVYSKIRNRMYCRSKSTVTLCSKSSNAMYCVAVCCNCVAVCCSVLQCVAVCCSVLQCVAVCCSALQCVAVRCSVLQCVAVCCSVLQCVAVRKM